ncbi:hypothetical protein EN943_04605 [Mesorhizobium sp. M7A.F.Ca.US.006.01.1.1]|uniref:hypothetical protein n=1 Tax=Mesorhizobium sp. M7A.F.Ca.US.006.01.1.1 TaxID=2496707 RepID=UPI000FCB82EB|nr:hypothetical protein [Mesorhizobium sp. M7A.F.Ca.US.006.01.1.1]RUZ80187.1 hypothetical protein EN943_04605 [Mesorhizobium sp. M7A.F.Ca.US.006.01.1.1]
MLIKRSADSVEKLENSHKYVGIFRGEEFYLQPDWRAIGPASLRLDGVNGFGTKKARPAGSRANHDSIDGGGNLIGTAREREASALVPSLAA